MKLGIVLAEADLKKSVIALTLRSRTSASLARTVEYVSKTKGAEMNELAADGRASLSSYETDQIEQIAAWKSTPPNAFAEIWKKITMPTARAIDTLVPKAWVSAAIDKSFDTAARLASQEELKRVTGAREISELRHRSLEECDRLANRVATSALIIATVQGAATGAGGVLTTFLDVPLLFVVSLRTVLKIGQCYGYALEDEMGRQYVLGVLVTAVSGSLEIRRHRLDGLREVEEWLIAETQEEVATEELVSLLFQLEIFDEVPGVGALSGGLLNLAFMRRMELTARRVFQERWLRDNGKIDVIQPAPVDDRHLAPGWSGAIRRAAYSSCYAAAYGVSVPVWLAAGLIRPIETGLRRGIKDVTALTAGRNGSGTARAYDPFAQPSTAVSLA